MNQTNTTPRRRPGRPPRRPPGPSELGGDTRSALLAAAMGLFARNGYDGTSIRAITRAAGTNLGAVTYHFGSKRALYAAVLEAGLTPLVERVALAAGSAGAPLDRLTRVVDVFFEHLAVHPDVPRLLLQEVAAGRKPPPEVVSIMQRNAANVIGVVEDGWRDGSIRPGEPIFSALSVAAQPIYMTVMAPLILQVAGIDLRDPTTRRRASEHVQTVVRNGLAATQETRP